MSSSTAMVAGLGAGLVGLALMVVETIRVLNGSALHGLNAALLFVGLGLLAIGGGLLVLAVVTEDATMHGATPAAHTDRLTETADDPA